MKGLFFYWREEGSKPLTLEPGEWISAAFDLQSRQGTEWSGMVALDTLPMDISASHTLGTLRTQALLCEEGWLDLWPGVGAVSQGDCWARGWTWWEWQGPQKYWAYGNGDGPGAEGRAFLAKLGVPWRTWSGLILIYVNRKAVTKHRREASLSVEGFKEK